jgi:hypothetical protein
MECGNIRFAFAAQKLAFRKKMSTSASPDVMVGCAMLRTRAVLASLFAEMPVTVTGHLADYEWHPRHIMLDNSERPID